MAAKEENETALTAHSAHPPTSHPSSNTPKPQSHETSREISAVVAVISEIADGNCASKADVKLVEGEAVTRAVRIGMKVGITWASSNATVAGNRPGYGSQYCDTMEDLRSYFGGVCGNASRDPAIAKQIAGDIALAPVKAMDSFPDVYRVKALPYTAHLVEECGRCHGRRQVTCNAHGCNFGTVQCTACSYTGRGVCSSCNGNGLAWINSRNQACPRCGGSGRQGSCLTCYGRLRYTCPTCSGSGTVSCTPCRATGCFTHNYATYLEGRVSRTIGFEADAPEGFKRSCKAVSPMSALATNSGSLVRPEVTSTSGQASLLLHCETRHVHVKVDCRGHRTHVDALGRSIPLMPPFLDKLLAELAADISLHRAHRPAHALSQALRTRVTRDVLTDVGRGKYDRAAATALSWKGAVSEAFVTDVCASLRVAYRKAARASVRRTWLLLAPVIIGGAFLANAYQVPKWILLWVVLKTNLALYANVSGLILGSEFVATIPLAMFVWLVAGRVGRRRLQAGVGDLARRRPRQGIWPVLGVLLATASGWFAAASGFGNSYRGSPWNYHPGAAQPAIASPSEHVFIRDDGGKRLGKPALQGHSHLHRAPP